MKTVTLKQVGYEFTGNALLNLWGGGQGTVKMDSWEAKGEFSRQKMIDGINDGQFGCESIDSAEIWVNKLFENGYTEYDCIIEIDGKEINC